MRREQAAYGHRPLAAGASCDEVGAASCSFSFSGLAEHGFDINHRCAVNRFERTDSETILQDPAHRDLMKADRIGPVWRPGGENPHQYSARI